MTQPALPESASSRRRRTLDLVFMSVAACCAIAAVGALDSLEVPGLDPIFLVGSLGASAVLLFGAPESPMSRVRNVIGGHVVSAVVGVTCFRLLGDVPYLAGGVAVGASILLMHGTKTLHAPGGATALIANIGSEKVKALGYGYVFAPVLSGVAVLLATAFVARILQERANAWIAESPRDEDEDAAPVELPEGA